MYISISLSLLNRKATSENIYLSFVPTHLLPRKLFASYFLFTYLLAFSVNNVLSAPEISPGTLMSKHPIDELDSQLHEPAKRSARTYSFGLGKKSDELAEGGPADEGSSLELMEELLDEEVHEKRAEPARFQFGLGKKAAPGPESRFSFGLGKRAAPRYTFGLGKRPMRYGLGKKAASRFAFGLGKREFGSMDYGDGDDFMKRRYSFGLGKRAPQRYSFGVGR